MFSLTDISFSKEAFAPVSKLFKAINQNLRWQEQLTVISGLQLEMRLMQREGAQVPTSVCKACRWMMTFSSAKRYEKWEEEDRAAELFLL